MFVFSFWWWWALGAVLMALEALLPGTIFLWMGIAALPVGLGAFFFPEMNLEFQVFIWAVLSFVSVVAGRRFYQGLKLPKSDLNQRGAYYKGRTVVLDEPLINGSSRVHVDDGIWTVYGPDAPQGTKMIVTGTLKNGLTVDFKKTSNGLIPKNEETDS